MSTSIPVVNTPAEKISMVVQEITDTVKLSQNEITAYGKREQILMPDTKKSSLSDEATFFVRSAWRYHFP